MHVAIPLLIYEIPPIKNKYLVNRLALVIGAMFPDFFDKPLELLGISSGRGYCHTLFFVGLTFVILFLATKKNKAVSYPFLIGMLIHLLLDMPVPLFYPFIQYQFVSIHANPIEYWTNNFTKSLIFFTGEIIGTIIIIFVTINNKLYSKSAVLNYLKTKEKI